MLVSLNGKLIAEEDAVVSVFDRAFRYGDALFEAVLVRHGHMFRWPQHAARLERSAAALRMTLPYSIERLGADARALVAANQSTDAVLRLQLSRGVGARGYAPSGDEQPWIVMSLHPAPTRPLPETPWKLTVSSVRVAANDAFVHHKTCSRLLQVMAAIEAHDRGVDESLLVNTDGHVTEGSSSNVFWIENGTVCTTPIHAGILPGITRAATLELCDTHGIPTAEKSISPGALLSCDGAFLSLTSRGIVEADSLDGKRLRRSPLTSFLRHEFEALLERECAAR